MVTLKTAIRFGFIALFSVSLIVTGWNCWHLVFSRGGQFLVNRAQSDITIALERLITRSTTQDQLENRLAAEIATEPQDWIVIKSLQEIAEDQRYSISDDLLVSLNAAYDEDHSILRMATACGDCAWDSATCEFSAAMACGVAVNLTPIGDVAGISRAGVNYVQGTPIDKIDVALSVVGLSATALAITTGGSSLSVKAGSGLLRFAYHARKIPTSIVRVLETAATHGIDWARLPAVRRIDDLSMIVRMDALRPAITASTSLGNIVLKTNTRQGLYLLERAENVADLRRISSVSEVLNTRTAGYFALLKKSRVLRATMRLADEVYGILVGIVGLILSVMGLLWSAVSNIIIRRLRRRTY